MHQFAICCLQFVEKDGGNYLIACDIFNILSFWYALHTKNKSQIKFGVAFKINLEEMSVQRLNYRDMLSIYDDSQCKQVDKMQSVQSMLYNDESLFIGDDNGNLSKWQISSIQNIKSKAVRSCMDSLKLVGLSRRWHSETIVWLELFDENEHILSYSTDGSVKIMNASNLRVDGTLKPDDSKNYEDSSKRWNVHFESISDFNQMKEMRLSTILETKQIDFDFEQIAKKNLFHLTQIKEFDSVYNKSMIGIDSSSFIPIRSNKNALMIKSKSTRNIRSNFTRMKDRKKKKRMRKSKSTGFIRLIPKQPTMLETDPLDGRHTISIGERVLVLEEDEAHSLRQLDSLLTNM